VTSSRRRAKGHVDRVDTGGSTVIATRGEEGAGRPHLSPASIAGIAGGAIAVALVAAAVSLVYAGVL
jgi:hypothetical protein